MAKRRKVTFEVQTQLVTIFNRRGDRVREARKGKWHRWRGAKQLVLNIEAAIKYVTGKMINDQVGGIVVLRQIVNRVVQPEITKIFQAKWGTDGVPFVRFDGIAGDFWMRRMSPALLKRLNRI